MAKPSGSSVLRSAAQAASSGRLKKKSTSYGVKELPPAARRFCTIRASQSSCAWPRLRRTAPMMRAAASTATATAINTRKAERMAIRISTQALLLFRGDRDLETRKRVIEHDLAREPRIRLAAAQIAQHIALIRHRRRELRRPLRIDADVAGRARAHAPADGRYPIVHVAQRLHQRRAARGLHGSFHIIAIDPSHRRHDHSWDSRRASLPAGPPGCQSLQREARSGRTRALAAGQMP